MPRRPPPLTRPDVLVLGAGGVLGEAWMTGLLAALDQQAGLDLRDCDCLVGTSAGAIVAAELAAGHLPEAPIFPESSAELSPQADLATSTAAALLSQATRFSFRVAEPFAELVLRSAAPAGALTRAALLRSLPTGRGDLSELHARVASWGARFDGRLRVVCVERGSGRRVVFGAPGAPRATVADAVEASCSVPWLYRPVRIGERSYVDGAVWSPTNLDVAPVGPDAEVLCLNPSGRNISASIDPVAAWRTASRPTAAVEAFALRRKGASVRVLEPDADAARALGRDFMDSTRRRRALAAGFEQGRRLAA